MSDETTQAILGDAVADSLEKPGRRRRGLFGWKKRVEDAPPPLTHCEDCGAELHGHYCAKCGQVAVDWPGWLTNQFIAGRRTRYLHPFRGRRR